MTTTKRAWCPCGSTTFSVYIGEDYGEDDKVMCLDCATLYTLSTLHYHMTYTEKSKEVTA